MSVALVQRMLDALTRIPIHHTPTAPSSTGLSATHTKNPTSPHSSHHYLQSKGRTQLNDAINKNRVVDPARAVNPNAKGDPAVAAQLDTVLGGKLQGKGQAFADSAARNNIDPKLLAAISMHETGNG